MLVSDVKTNLDPLLDNFITGYIIKFSCDFADSQRFENRWGLVHAGLKLAFGEKAPLVSETEDFANKFDSDDFHVGIAVAEVDILEFTNFGTPPIRLSNYIRETYS